MQTPASPVHLRGPDVHIFHEGRLWHKPSLLRPRRVVIARLHGLTLTLTHFPTTATSSSISISTSTTALAPSSSVDYALRGARVRLHVSSLKLVLVLACGRALTLMAETIADFNEWADALRDALDWNFDHFYAVCELLGKGSFAEVRRARHRATNDDAAVKIIRKQRCTNDELRYMQREIDIGMQLRHPNIAAVSDLFQSDDALYIVFELVPGGTLQTALEANGPFHEDETRAVMADLLKAVTYIHSHGIVHRDLKPENILCSSPHPPLNIKLIDFGLARRLRPSPNSHADTDGLGPHGLMTTPVGTPHFVAPEVLCSLPYGCEVDMFACGVILFWLLSGTLPFDDACATRLVEAIRQVDYTFDHPAWAGVSADAMHLVSSLLQRSPFQRLSAADALLHPWFGDHRRPPPPPCPRPQPHRPPATSAPGYQTQREFDFGGASINTFVQRLPSTPNTTRDTPTLHVHATPATPALPPGSLCPLSPTMSSHASPASPSSRLDSIYANATDSLRMPSVATQMLRPTASGRLDSICANATDSLRMPSVAKHSLRPMSSGRLDSICVNAHSLRCPASPNIGSPTTPDADESTLFHD